MRKFIGSIILILTSVKLALAHPDETGGGHLHLTEALSVSLLTIASVVSVGALVLWGRKRSKRSKSKFE